MVYENKPKKIKRLLNNKAKKEFFFKQRTEKAFRFVYNKKQDKKEKERERERGNPKPKYIQVNNIN